MWRSGERDEHLLVQPGYGFLGGIEHYKVAEDQAGRTYDFEKVGDADAKKALKEVQKAGQVVSVHAPAVLFGPSRWADLTEAEAAILKCLIGEVTRPPGKKRSRRPDGAGGVHGSRVPGAVGGSTVGCPLLNAKAAHVAF